MKKTYVAPALSLNQLTSADVIAISKPFMELGEYGSEGGMSLNVGDFWE